MDADVPEGGDPSTRRTAMRIMLAVVGMGAAAALATLGVLWSGLTTG